MSKLFSFILGFTCIAFTASTQSNQIKILQVPGTTQFAKIDEKGISVLPSGRYVTPAGQLIRITHDPFALKLSPNGKKAITLHDGVFTLIDIASMNTTRVPSYDNKIVSPFSNGSYLGVAFSADSKTVYLSGGDNGAVLVYDLEQMKRLDSISLNAAINNRFYDDSFTADLLLSKDGTELMVLDRGNFRMVRLQLASKKITASIPVGRQPFGLALSPDESTAFVANVGAYSYPLIEGANRKNYDSLMISHHPYGDNTKESREGTVVEGRKIPGVGSPNADEAMSVFAIDLNTNKVIDKFKTGYQVGEMIEEAEVVGGASPNSIAVGKDFAYVSNATNDNISIIDYKNHKLLGHINITVDSRIDKYRACFLLGLP
jgi:DNA-binding beta-propeller fold protein YncE